MDRFDYCLDWVMGVPEHLRHKLPVGTGLVFHDKNEWLKLGQNVPVQPHLGDHMIDSCNSLQNCRYALEAGVTTMGNISHYYTYEYPGVEMEKERDIDMVKAIALMGKFKDQGTIIHSNVDDGFSALKAIGVEQLEENFGVGEADKLAMRGRNPVWPTNIVQTIMKKQDAICDKIDQLDGSLAGCRVIVGSTDVHEFGKEIVKNVLKQAGATVFDLGSNVPTEEIFETILETESAVIAMSTFNGIALSYAKEVLEGLETRSLKAKLIMGGLLNECQDGSDLPVDVSQELKDLGVSCDNDAATLVQVIQELI